LTAPHSPIVYVPCRDARLIVSVRAAIVTATNRRGISNSTARRSHRRGAPVIRDGRDESSRLRKSLAIVKPNHHPGAARAPSRNLCIEPSLASDRKPCQETPTRGPSRGRAQIDVGQPLVRCSTLGWSAMWTPGRPSWAVRLFLSGRSGRPSPGRCTTPRHGLDVPSGSRTTVASAPYARCQHR
jgi:hypothetical protein